MMISLPSSPTPNGVRPFLLDFGGVLRPYSGAKVQRLNRLGMRFGAQVSLPPLRSDTTGLLFVSRLAQAMTDELLLDCPLVDGTWSAAGSTKVKVAVTGGMTLQIKGFPAAYSVPEGRIFSVVSGGRRWVHMFSANGTADGVGDLVAAIFPPIRTGFSVNDVIEIDAPKMQGHVVDDRLAWEMALARRTSLSFTIEESE